MKSRRSWWLIYTLCAAAVGCALLWITIMVLRLETAEREARAEMHRQESLRLALWRMDSWFAPRLAREAARPYFEYLPYYPQERAYTSLLDAIRPGEVLTPSPLLTFASDIFLLHFQMTDDGELTSPQVPEGNLRDLAESDLLDSSAIEASAARLAEIAPSLAQADVAARLDEAETLMADLAAGPVAVPLVMAPPQSWPGGQQRKTDAERQARSRAYQQAQQEVIQQEMSNPANYLPDMSPDADGIVIGSFAPMWLGKSGETAAEPLVLVRRVRIGRDVYTQGILIDWPALRAALLAEVADLLPESRLMPVSTLEAGADSAGRVLATIPVALESGALTAVAAAGLTPARLTLVLIWLAMIITVIAVAITLRASIAYGERRSRFASAVTHELRTPLTTFRMYSEMLADDMVQDEAQRRSYLATLKEESGRLATLVENVLTYARLEEGRSALQRRRTTVREMSDRIMPQLVRRAEEASMSLRVDMPDDLAQAPLDTDADAVGQVLLNLVDNACKYAAGATSRDIHLIARRRREQLTLSVCDHGPGIDAAFQGDLFIAFRRAERAGGDAVPGVGLGLALARALARDLGGELTLDAVPPIAADDLGACFTVTLPLAGE